MMINSDEETANKLTKKDLRQISVRYMFGGQLGWNYERMMNVAPPYCISFLPKTQTTPFLPLQTGDADKESSLLRG